MVCRCCFDRSGTRLLVASDDKTIRVYNSEDGSVLGR